MAKEYPNITVDAVVFSYIREKLHMLLIKRNLKPFKGKYALAGAFIKDDETANDAVIRMLKEEGFGVEGLTEMCISINWSRIPSKYM